MRGLACNRCMEHWLDCVAGVGGKATACITCQNAKAKCKWPGEESGEKKVCWRKRAAQESPKGKKRKKAWTELEAGLSRGVALEGLQVSSKVVENLGDLMRGLLWWLDCQNALLTQLVQLKADEVWRAETSDGEGSDDGIGRELAQLDAEKAEEQREEMAAWQVQADADAKRAAEATEGSEKSETGRDDEEEEETLDSMV